MSDVIKILGVELSVKDIEDHMNYVHMFTGLRITVDQFKKIFEEHADKKWATDFVREISFGFDTVERERFCDMLSIRYTGLGWPSNSSSRDPEYGPSYWSKMNTGFKSDDIECDED